MVFRKASPLPCFRSHVLTTSRSLGFSLRNATARLPPDRTRDVLVHLDAGEHLAPELGQIVVHDGDRGEAGVDHLEHVIVFEHVGGLRRSPPAACRAPSVARSGVMRLSS